MPPTDLRESRQGILRAERGELCHRHLGRMINLMRESALHQQWPIGEIDHYILPPLKLGQVQFFYRPQKRLVGFVTWAMISPDLAAGMTQRSPELLPDQWQSGDRSWIIDMVAPFGDVRSICCLLAKTIFADQEVMSLRRAKDGSVRKVGRWTGERWRAARR